MSVGRLRIDKGAETFLLTCRDCISLAVVEASLLEAWKAGRRHERSAHPGSQQADAAIRQIERKAAR